jgi:hypothetical protein
MGNARRGFPRFWVSPNVTAICLFFLFSFFLKLARSLALDLNDDDP